jgi:hypothetical protein
VNCLVIDVIVLIWGRARGLLYGEAVRVCGAERAGVPGHQDPRDLRSEAPTQRVSPPPPRRPSSPLPAGTRISALGELTISSSSPEDLLGRVMRLALSAARDLSGFGAALSFGFDGGPAREPTQAPKEP